MGDLCRVLPLRPFGPAPRGRELRQTLVAPLPPPALRATSPGRERRRRPSWLRTTARKTPGPKAWVGMTIHFWDE